MKTGIVIQARMGSERLPGKVLKKVCGKTLLEILLTRVSQVKNADQIIVATTTKAIDDVIVSQCDSLGISIYRGSEDDVLDRYLQTALQYNLDNIVRITSDCPLADANLIDQIILKFQANQDLDYFTNTVERTYPRGLDVEIFRIDALKKASIEAVSKSNREHVTQYFYQNPETFKIGQYTDALDFNHYRWTVDTPEDFELISIMIERLFPKNHFFTYNDCLNLIEKEPSLSKINAHIEQKKST